MKLNKILFVNGPGAGGTENVTFIFSKILAKAGYDCSALILQCHGAKSDMCPNIPSGLTPTVYIGKFRYYIFALLKQIRRVKPNIVFCSMPDRSHLILLLKMLHLYNGKLVIRENNMPSKQEKRIVYFSKLLYRYADRIISQTVEMKQEIMDIYHVPSDLITVINNPIDDEVIQFKLKEKYLMDSSFINYLTVCRISSQKDLRTMIGAFSKLLIIQPQSRLYIVGAIKDKAYADSILQLCADLKVDDKVFFQGFQTNPIKYIEACDVFVLSSIFEGLPNAMLEAMYLGKPVAVTECIPYISKVVKNGLNGYVCDVQDVDGLAEAMIKANEISGLARFNDVNKSDKKIIELFGELIN